MPKVRAVVEHGHWRIKNFKTGEYFCSASRLDLWNEAGQWWTPETIKAEGGGRDPLPVNSKLATYEPEREDDGRAVRMLAAILEDRIHVA